jgi:nucleotide-binding universal stress UspA family protein
VERKGHVGDEIVAEIESGDYDLVVLGSRGHGRLATEILGSVNNHVHYHSNVPTLTVDAAEAVGSNRVAEEVTVEVG